MKQSLRNSLWLWGTRVNALAAHYRLPASSMTIGGGLGLLGIDQAMMSGHLPPTEDEYRPVAGCHSLFWEMSFDEGFSFRRPLAPIVGLHRAHPNLRAVLLDDFSTTEINKGAKPELLARLRAAMPDSLELWVVIYSMSLGIPNLSDYLEHVDGISFWVWRPADLAGMGDYVAQCHRLSGHKPLIVGLYLYDFDADRPLPSAIMESQIRTAHGLFESGECTGLCFLSSSILDIGLESVEVTRRWIASLG